MMNMEFVALGYFDIKSGKMRVTDPCYDKSVWCTGVLDNVKNGTWKSSLMLSDEGMWGKRVAELHVWFSDQSVIDSIVPTEKTDIVVGVDSGQAGFFDEAVYPNDTECDETFYGKVCNMTLGKNFGGVVPFGAVSRSGYGDGGYECYVARNDAGEVVAAKIVYISEKEEDDMYDLGEDDFV